MRNHDARARAEEREEREKEERRHTMDADGFILVERRSKVRAANKKSEFIVIVGVIITE